MKCVLYALIFAVSAAGTDLMPNIYTDIHRHILNQEYKKARDLIAGASLPQADSLFYVLSVENARIIDYEAFHPEYTDFTAGLHRALELFREKRDKTPQDTFFTASLHGMYGLHRMKTGRTLNGLSATRRGVQQMRRLKDRGYTALPLLETIALYNYYSAKTFSWLPFSDDPAGARTQLETLAEKPSFFSFFTRQNLFWIYYDMNDFSRALAHSEEILHTYPHNTTALRAHANALHRRGSLDEAQKTAELLLRISRERTPRNLADILSAAVIMADVHLQRGEKEMAEEIITAFTRELQPTSYEVQIEWVQKHRNRLTEMKEAL
ncbi:MAG: tetratricopeptide repeat protein [Fibrobacterota bacterium]